MMGRAQLGGEVGGVFRVHEHDQLRDRPIRPSPRRRWLIMHVHNLFWSCRSLTGSLLLCSCFNLEWNPLTAVAFVSRLCDITSCLADVDVDDRSRADLVHRTLTNDPRSRPLGTS